MKSLVIKRSIIVNGRSTSVSVEEPFWIGLKEIAKGEGTALGQLVGCRQTHAVAAPALRGNSPSAPRNAGSPT